MPRPDWEDLSPFFDLDDFAVTARFEREGIALCEVVGIFDDPTVLLDLGEYQHEAAIPAFVCRDSDATGIQRGDVAVIETETFDVMSAPDHDGTGIATIRMSHQNMIYHAGP